MNTFGGAEHTYVSPTGYTSRVDYMAVPVRIADTITITTLHNQETATMADQKPDNDVQGKYNIIKIIS